MPTSSRPTYETKQDLANEQSVIDLLTRRWALQKVHKMPISYGLDYFVEALERQFVMEIKCRTHEFDKYPTLFLSVLKWHRMIRFARAGLAAVLAVRFTDGVWFCAIDEETIGLCSYKWGGRTVQTRDPADIEPIVEIPLALFKPVVDTKPQPEG